MGVERQVKAQVHETTGKHKGDLAQGPEWKCHWAHPSIYLFSLLACRQYVLSTGEALY